MESLNNDNQFKEEKQGDLRVFVSKSIKVVSVPNFLPVNERDALYKAVCVEQDEFKNYNPLLPDIKATRFLDLSSDKVNKVKTSLTQKAYKKLSKSIIKQLPSLLEALNIKSFTTSDIQLTFVNCPDGHYGNPHSDSTNGLYDISILYYFNSVPKVFLGGDLEVFDGKNSSSNPDTEPVFTIDFEDNLLLAFASETVHGVTKVQSSSTKFEDNRFIAVGFLSSKKE
ncbi:2OG-Fe(II) oxygenase [Tenacibaculum ovolyticum]|uniref:2OG-Fe(II) oxygenase n=2 Tax=Tenacibaculum ovolyticum TaxID=104270 RepID=UPI0003FC5086|nr:2OG-Fe(II) oxygenase [Tenacibaculum ovolyticum]